MQKGQVKKELIRMLIEEDGVRTVQDVEAALKDMFKDTLQSMMEAEFDTQMGYEKYDHAGTKSNYRNGYSKKNVLSSYGDFDVAIPRDRNAEFDPQVIPKNQRNISHIESEIIEMYGRGTSTRDITKFIKSIYGINVSAEMISNITDRVLDDMEKWRNRPLFRVYPFIFIDAIYYSVQEEHRIIKKAAYVALGYNCEGYKEVLGIWLAKEESASFWLNIFNELQSRGVEDILILCSDGLKGIKEAIDAAFPKAIQQRCIVHLIRNTCKYIAAKNRNEICADLKKIYNASSERAGHNNLLKVKTKWEKQYPRALNPWIDNWNEIRPIFDYSPAIRKIMYTTNSIESLNRQYRRYTKTKSAFPHDTALLKSMYLATLNIEETWNRPHPKWGEIYNQLNILHPDRLEQID